MAGTGTGYPVYFICPVARRNRDIRTWAAPPGHRRIVRTGRTKPMPPGRAHPRKLNTSHEYRCGCGHVGWSSHVDIARYPVE